MRIRLNLIKILKKIEDWSANAQNALQSTKMPHTFKSREEKINEIKSILRGFSFSEQMNVRDGELHYQTKNFGNSSMRNTLVITKDGFHCEIDGYHGVSFCSDENLIDEVNVDKLRQKFISHVASLKEKEATLKKERLDRKRAQELVHIENQSKLLRLLNPIKVASKNGVLKEGHITFKLANKKGRLKDINLVYVLSGGLYKAYLTFDNNCVDLATIEGDRVVVKSVREQEVWNHVRRMTLIEDEIVSKLEESLSC